MKKLIPYEIDGERISIDYLIKIIEPNLSQIETDLVGDLSYYSESSQYTPGSLKIMSITATSNEQYSMSYRFKWSIFNGCLDINAEEFTNECVSFKVKNHGLEFDIIDTKRSTSAEEL